MTTKPLTIRALKYVDELLSDPELRQEAAAIRAGYSPRSASIMASTLMADERVKAAIAERGKARLKRLELTQDDVLRDLYHVATADPRDLTEYKIGCCRYCHGDGHMYQMTPQEYRDRLEKYLADVGEKDPAGLMFNVQGGVGFRKSRPPNPECPECDGEGVGRMLVKDSGKLGASARILFAGVKETKNGLEVMMRNKDKAIDLAARHTGVVRPSLELTGANGGPLVQPVVVTLDTTDPIEAARRYQKLMGGN